MKTLRLIILHWLFPASCYCPKCWSYFADDSFYTAHYKAVHNEGATGSGKDIVQQPFWSQVD